MSPQGLSASALPALRAKHFSHHHQGWFGRTTHVGHPEGKRRCKPTHNRLILVGVAVLNRGKGKGISCLEFSRVEIGPSWLPHVICQEMFLPSSSFFCPSFLPLVVVCHTRVGSSCPAFVGMMALLAHQWGQTLVSICCSLAPSSVCILGGVQPVVGSVVPRQLGY